MHSPESCRVQSRGVESVGTSDALGGILPPVQTSVGIEEKTACAAALPVDKYGGVGAASLVLSNHLLYWKVGIYVGVVHDHRPFVKYARLIMRNLGKGTTGIEQRCALVAEGDLRGESAAPYTLHYLLREMVYVDYQPIGSGCE